MFEQAFFKTVITSQKNGSLVETISERNINERAVPRKTLLSNQKKSQVEIRLVTCSLLCNLCNNNFIIISFIISLNTWLIFGDDGFLRTVFRLWLVLRQLKKHLTVCNNSVLLSIYSYWFFWCNHELVISNYFSYFRIISALKYVCILWRLFWETELNISSDDSFTSLCYHS